MTKGLVSLCMIVKDEARGIKETLESVRPFVDRWRILDTGSTDGTQQIVREVMPANCGQLDEEPFVDFATTRNRALELADDECEFVLMLSGDETLRGGQELRAELEKRAQLIGPNDEVYLVPVRYGEMTMMASRIIRTGRGWKYHGVTHEYLAKDGARPPKKTLPGTWINHDRTGQTNDSCKPSWERDKALLLRELAANPDDPRTVFYLAQTYFCLGEWKRAREFYERRAGMGLWWEEVYESKYRLGHIAAALGRPWHEVQQLYLDAHAYAPHRAEPLYVIADHWWHEQNYALSYLFCRRAVEMPLPANDYLFVLADVYTYYRWDLLGALCWHMKDFELGEIAVQQALKAKPNEPHLQQNLETYAKARQQQVAA